MRRTRAAPSLAGRYPMVPQERDLITTLLARLKSAGGQPKDPEADTLIRQAMVEQPDAPYYLVQTVLIQDLSLHQAQNRIAELEGQLANAQPAKPTSFLGGLLGTSQTASPAAGSVPSAGPWARTPQVAPAPPPQQGYANSLTGGMGMTSGLGETVVNNYYGDSGAGGTDYGGGGDTGYAGGGADYGGGGTAGGGDYSGGVSGSNG